MGWTRICKTYDSSIQPKEKYVFDITDFAQSTHIKQNRYAGPMTTDIGGVTCKVSGDAIDADAEAAACRSTLGEADKDAEAE